MNLSEWLTPAIQHLSDAGKKTGVELYRLVRPLKYTRDEIAYDEGWKAYEEVGDPLNPPNPYTEGTDRYHFWNAGYEASCSDSMHTW